MMEAGDEALEVFAHVGVPERSAGLVVLLVGSRGFIGARIAAACEALGLRVVRADRPEFDFARDRDPGRWSARLDGIDLVVNAAGILRDADGQSLEAVHALGPIALFTACAERGVPVIQVSALGAAADAPAEFLRSKHRADAALLALPVPSAVLQPSLVYGPGGASARLFTMMASLPLVPVPGQGAQRVQPVHVEDVAAAVARLAQSRDLRRERMPVVGPSAITLRELLVALRRGLGKGPARFIAVPMPLVRLAARLGVGLLDRESLAMLERGSVGDVARLREVLGGGPRAPERFIASADRHDARRAAAFAWLRPVLIASVAFVWIATAIVSAGIYPVADSLALLARVGLTGTVATVALYGAAVLDLVLGIATLVLRRRRMLWATQAALILGYTAVITLFLPEQWLHPYGPVTKNLPLLAALWLLHETEDA